jgi:hypothetical protein
MKYRQPWFRTKDRVVAPEKSQCLDGVVVGHFKDSDFYFLFPSLVG